MMRIIMPLIIAVVAIFMLSCEEVLEKGTIRGNVSDEGSEVSGAYVLLLDSGSFIDGDQPLDNGSITDGDGDYIILMVEPGKYYYVVAVKDNNGDLKYTPGVDEVGYYGDYMGFNWIPTEVTVGSGGVLEGIDITEMYIL